MKKKLSHIDDSNQPAMVDVAAKGVTLRTAHARARMHLPAVVQAALKDGEIHAPKGPVFQTAIIAGTMAVKRTHELIPFCHPLAIEGCRIEIAAGAKSELLIDCRVRVTHKTGVEMEALTGATIAALTVYDMCKALSHEMVIADVRLIEKTGGKTDLKADRA